ncbi:MAG: universal stress protein [Saprospiraceae bacterium]|nr:universal stress protein [Saprospiraceae bacterium]
MIQLKIYGTGTASYEMVKNKIMAYLELAGIEYKLEEERNISNFIKDQVHSVPAIKVNDDTLIEIEGNGRFNASLRHAIQSILKIENFGNMKKLIVPTDFSEPSYNAYNYANGLAQDLNAMLVMTHVYFPTSADFNELSVPDNNLEQYHRKKLDDFVHSVNQDWIGEFMHEPLVESEFRVGFPKTELTELSKQENVAMVMGSTGEGDSFKKIFGSLSIDMMKNASCPLFVIPPDFSYATPKNVVFASESLKTDSNNIFNVATMSEKFGAMIKIVHVDTNDEEYNIDLLEEILKKNFKNLNYQIKVIKADNVLKGLDAALEGVQYDLLVFTKKHRNFLAELFHESISEHFALYSQKPVLIYPVD